MLVPATAVTSQLEDALYLASILLLSLLLARPIYGLYGAAQTRGAEAVATGVADMIDSLTPGGSATLSLEVEVGVTYSVDLSGHAVAVSFGGSTAASQVDATLPTATLTPGNSYRFVDTGGRISLAQARPG